MLELFEARSIKELKSTISNYLSNKSELEIVTISHCNVEQTGPLGGYNLWNALVYFRKKS